MPTWLRRAGWLLGQTIQRSMKDNTPMLSAGLSFYALLSLAPALWVVVAAVGAVIGRDSARFEIVQWITMNVGPRAGTYINGVAADVETGSPLATVAGLISMFFGATLSFGALYDSLSLIWRSDAASNPAIHTGWLRGWLVGEIRGYLTKRLLAFVVVLLGSMLLLASLILTSFVTASVRLMPQFLPVPALVLQAANFVVSTALMMILFAAIYRILHSSFMEWHDVWMGAGVTAFLFSVGKTLIGMYLGSDNIGSAYGAGGSLLVLLLWVYYSAQIFLFGAEFTEVYARSRKTSRVG